MKTKLNQGFTLIELLVVITIIAILASLAVPTFGRIQERGNITKATSNCKQIITALRIYSSDNNGLYPDAAAESDSGGSGGSGGGSSDSNTIFIKLFESDVLDNETIFGCPVSRLGNPDGKIGTSPNYDQALLANENHWAMTVGASDTASGSLPLVFENAVSDTWDPNWDPTKAGQTAAGRTWSGGKVVIGLNDSSVTTYDVATKTGPSQIKGGQDNVFARHGTDYDVAGPKK